MNSCKSAAVTQPAAAQRPYFFSQGAVESGITIMFGPASSRFPMVGAPGRVPTLPNFQPKEKASRPSARVQESAHEVVRQFVKDLITAASISSAVQASSSLLAELEQYQNDRWAVEIRRLVSVPSITRHRS